MKLEELSDTELDRRIETNLRPDAAVTVDWLVHDRYVLERMMRGVRAELVRAARAYSSYSPAENVLELHVAREMVDRCYRS